MGFNDLDLDLAFEITRHFGLNNFDQYKVCDWVFFMDLSEQTELKLSKSPETISLILVSSLF